MCNHLCNIKTRLCGRTAHCELSLESVFGLHLLHWLPLWLTSTTLTDLYIRTVFLRVECNLFSLSHQFTYVEGYALQVLHLPSIALTRKELLFFPVRLCLSGAKSHMVPFLLSWMYFMLHWVLSSPPCRHHSVNKNGTSHCHSQTVHCSRTDAL